MDKTGFIIPLLEGAGIYFLSRPRLFGKSLFLSTLESFFTGRRELFKGLAIDSYEWDWAEYPIIRLNLGEGGFSKATGLDERLVETLRDNARKYGIELKGSNPRVQFRNLIMDLKEKYGRNVVVLIDEYEKPLLDSIDEPHFEPYKKELREFYSVLKQNEESIGFVFITGVTRFGHLNIFSGLNNLKDISLDKKFSALCGITEEELRQYFVPGIEDFAAEEGLREEEIFERLKLKYNGYHFSSALIDIYNPFSILDCIDSRRFTDTWFNSGSSTYLINQLRKNRFDFSRLEGIRTTENKLLGVDANMTDSITLLYQSGYLTIKDYDPNMELYTLGFPNREIASAIYSVIVPYYLGEKFSESKSDALEFVNLLKDGNAEEFMKKLKGYFGGIPYDMKLDYGSDFQNVVYAFFAHIGLLSNTTLEKHTSDGRIDLVLEMKDFVYVFEFKLGTDASKALAQINSKEYDLQWNAAGREVFKIGVAFSSKTRGIASYAIEQ